MTLIPPDIHYGPFQLRIRKQGNHFAGIIVGNAKEVFTGPTEEAVEKILKEKAASMNKGFIGLAGAKSRFLRAFPGGFSDQVYFASGAFGERGYKLDQHKRVATEMPIEKARKGKADPEVALRLFRAINLADPFTKARMADVLRGKKAKRFLQVAAQFADGEIRQACSQLNAEFGNERVNSWVCMTFFPFFWKPDAHFFLKPEFTKEFAERIGDDFQFAYESAPNSETYSSLLAMVDRTSEYLADLEPKDNIDIHSFMFVTVEYTDKLIDEIIEHRSQA